MKPEMFNFDASLLPPMPPALASVSGSALASNLAGQKDSIIRICVNEALGNEAWLIGDIAPRMRRVKIEGQESETITLDGKPLLEIWPPEIKTVQEGDSIKLVATCKYRTFKAQNDQALRPARSPEQKGNDGK